MSNGVYNSLKWTALVLLPGLGALYFGLGQIWEFPEVEKVVGSVTVVETFIGLLLRKKAAEYGTVKTVGQVIVGQDADGHADGLRFVLDAEARPVILEDKKVVQFEVLREVLQ